MGGGSPLSRLWTLLRGATLADAFVLLAALTLVAALLAPRWSARAFRERVAAAVTDVESVAAAARQARNLQRRWPAPALAGEAPEELSALGGSDGPFSRSAYELGWTTWQVVDSVEAPPEPAPPPTPGDPPQQTGPRLMPVTRTVGAVTVQAGEDALLTELLRHYGTGASFLLDSTWVLVLPERAEQAQGPGLPFG